MMTAKVTYDAEGKKNNVKVYDQSIHVSLYVRQVPAITPYM